MNKAKLPSNIKSVIIAIDDELQIAYKSISTKTDTFIEQIDALIYYYYPTIYKRVFKKQITDDILINLKHKLDNFIYILTTAIYKCINNKTLYDEILEEIAKHIIVTYNDLQIEYAIQNKYTNIFVISSSFSNLIYTPDEYFKMKRYINPLQDILILPNCCMNCTLQNISFFNMPQGLKGYINKLLFLLTPYKQYITTKNIYFDNIMEVYKNEPTKTVISYRYGFNEIQYNIIYLLLKDELLKIYDEDLWRTKFTDILSNTYIADNCYKTKHWLYHVRAEINHIEYFMSCIVAYILNKEQLKYGDIKSYEYIKRLLDKEI